MRKSLENADAIQVKGVDYMDKIIEKFEKIGCKVETWFNSDYNATVYTAVYNEQKIELKYLSCVMGDSAYIKIEEMTADVIIDIITKYEPKAGDKVLYRIGDEEEDIEEFKWGKFKTKPCFYHHIIGIEKT